ncbi:hypothetical protein [Cryobacterium soli]|uniref:hypothetical protein n=1 Tax=Cryobacterium soli TaxID=2220095 RepID=UPI0013C468A0|nr:hypothetical protein [Cryobacterium soli]
MNFFRLQQQLDLSEWTLAGPTDIHQGCANDEAQDAAPDQCHYQAALRVPLESANENNNRSSQGKNDAAQHERTTKTS